jgi:tRNA (cytidine/uridine-2'-O-)-methyltransferase
VRRESIHNVHGMFEIVLHEPQIPPNAGNVMRLCANTGARLHLIEPLGFVLSDRRLRRAGLDYEDRTRTLVHARLGDCERMLTGRRWFAVSTRGEHLYTDFAYQPGDVFVFGAETRGLPAHVLAEFGSQRLIRLPMAASSRSLNLANAVAVVIYEAWRQCGFAGAPLSPRERGRGVRESGNPDVIPSSSVPLPEGEGGNLSG